VLVAVESFVPTVLHPWGKATEFVLGGRAGPREKPPGLWHGPGHRALATGSICVLGSAIEKCRPVGIS